MPAQHTLISVVTIYNFVKLGMMGRWGDGEMGRWGDGEMG